MSTPRNAVLAAFNTGDTPTEAQFANWINLCKFGVTQTRAQIQAMIAATNLDTNTIYNLTGGPSSNVLIVFPTAANAISDAAINLTTGEFGDYDIATNTFTAQGGSGSFLPLAGGSLTGTVNDAKGADIASAGTTDIGAATGNYVVVTGTTTITALGTVQAGAVRIVRFSGALILTHNATSLILPTAANITTAAGDVAVFVSEGSGNWRCTGYLRANGQALAGGGGGGDMTLAGVQTVTGAKTFEDTTLLLRNAGQTASSTLKTDATTSRTYTIPEAGAAAAFVMSEGAQTINGAKTFNNATLLLRNSGNTQSSTLATAATASRTYTIPEAGAAASFVMTEGSQTVNGAKTFGTTVAITGAAATTPHFALSAFSGTYTGSTDGQLVYNNESGSRGLLLVKDTITNRVLTDLTNPTLVGGTGQAPLQSDASGNITKAAEFDILGVYAQTNVTGVTVGDDTAETTILGTVVGSKTVNAGYMAAGKTFVHKVAGVLSKDSGSDTCTIRIDWGSVSVVTAVITAGGTLTNEYFEVEAYITVCNTGATPDLNVAYKAMLQGAVVAEGSSAVTGPSTASSITFDVTAEWSVADAANTVTSRINTMNYIN
jgi:hypothetical protein